MYGTRDAANNWEGAYTDFMLESGFQMSRSTPCVFYHRAHNIRVVVHGDDFTVLGCTKSLDWFRGRIQARFEVKFKARLGPQEPTQSVRVLNRIVTWTSEGLVYEPDQRHAEIIVRDLGLRGAKPVCTPGVVDRSDDDPTPLSDAQTTRYRALVARAI